MRTRKLFALAAALALLCAGCGAPAEQPAVTSTEPETAQTTERTISDHIPHSELLDCLYYEDSDFHIYDERSSAYETDGVPMCGTAPHHLAAGHFIAGLYKTAAKRSDIETVVLLAPMHYDSSSKLITSAKGWSTAFGNVTNDTDVTELFVSRLGAVKDDDMTEFDHSASSHIPFIKRYLPEAKVAVLLISPRADRDIPKKLSELLSEISREKSCFFAFSVDFSHYLDPDEADKHDAETLDAVMSRDTETIERFTNSNVDTPYGLSTFVRLSELLGCTTKKADSGNTFTVGFLPYSRTLFPEGVTSYFVFISQR